ncbi:MAG: hypothetical protein JWO22_1834 [Frankiales bacterium]|nr:hypothetical protein [Frankiales bacterium]
MTRVRIAWALVVLSALCATADTVLTAAHGSLLSRDTWFEHGWPMISLATLGLSLMGALVVSRYPRQPLGWLLLVAGVSSVSISAEAYERWAFEKGGHGPPVLGHVAGWLSALAGAPLAMTCVIVIFLIAPDGRLLSPAWRWVVRSAVGGYALYAGSVLSVSPLTFDVDAKDPGPVLVAVTAVGITLMILSLLASAVGIAVRLHRSQGEVRRQLLWIAVSAALLAGSFAWFLFVQRLDSQQQSDVSEAFLYAAYLSVPLCTAVAVLRHRLVDIDVIVNRALVLFLATGFAAGAYVLVVVSLGSAVGGQVEFLPSLLATALVALAFQPLRQRVVRLADRLAFGAAAEPYLALADFSRRLGESPDPTQLLPAVAEAAASAVGARRVAVELALPFGAMQAETRPSKNGAPALEIPLEDEGEVVGTLTVEMPPGRGLRTRDTALLHDLAAQASIAFRNARLSAELSHQVEKLDQQAQALEESRRRLISAGDAERRRLERAISREVAPHLVQVPGDLEQLAHHDLLTAELVRPYLASAEHALEALREITRGVYPAQLGRVGLEPALRSLLARTPQAHLHVEGGGRVDDRIEAAAYFCVAEAVRNLDGQLEVTLRQDTEGLGIRMVAQTSGGLSVAHMRDRVEALDGSVLVSSAGAEATIEVRLPLAAVLVTR